MPRDTALFAFVPLCLSLHLTQLSMDSYQNIKFENNNGIALLTINRPDKLNALNMKTVEEIGEAIQVVYDTSDIKAVIITGAGEKAFVAGADISEIAELTEVNSRKFSEQGQDVFATIENCHKPVIALVNGFALGGGCELAMACHMRIATSNAKFGLPEVNLGIIPGFGGTQRLTQHVGKGKAFELATSGDMINAENALSIGLVNHVMEDKSAAMTKAVEILAKIVNKAPLAVGMVIDCINAVYNDEVDGYQMEANSFANCVKTEDFTEGTQAFLEKRKPNFIGE
jgi:enoyl-CoA hydratase